MTAPQPTFTPPNPAQRLAVPATERFDVGADTGTLQAIAYTSRADGDAYVEIKGDTIYARAQLSSLSNAETPAGAKFKVKQDNVNLRAAPWGNVLGTTMNGSEFSVTGRAGD